jgi:hypothetical protein
MSTEVKPGERECLDCDGAGYELNPTPAGDEVLGCLTCRGTGEAR